MRRFVRFGVLAAAVLALAIPAGALSASGAAPPVETGVAVHDLSTPLSRAKREARQQALELKLAGKVAKDAKKAKLPNGRYVELSRESTDRVFVVIAEYGNTRHPSYPDGDDTFGEPAVEPDGPEHNSIWQPDRKVDNTTLWQPDFSEAHYENMYFTRMADYYEQQSSGRYSVEGQVTEWVKVPHNAARYGRDFCGGIVCSNTWWLISHAMTVWVQEQLDDGMTIGQVTDYLKTFDQWDRYDHDFDGNFDEPDGYIDHFQIVHAGGDQAAGDPQQNADAIWSHRWYVQLNPFFSTGPEVGGVTVPFGGINIGEPSTLSGMGLGGAATGTLQSNPTGVWVGDYTIQPENGGLGVFAHEYGHDLDLPDLYDTSGNTGGAENSTGFWTLMSSGANIGDGGKDGIGDDPTDLGAWEKFQLGWLNYDVGFAGSTSTHRLGPAEFNSKYAQGLFVLLPDKIVDTTIADPYEGSKFYYSGSGNDLDNTMTREVTLPAAGPGVDLELKAMVNVDIETDWDYAYLTVDGTPVETSVSTTDDPNSQNFGYGITGSTGGDWMPMTADLSPFAGQTVDIGFRYWTDGFVAEPGFMVDALEIPGEAFDGAESDAGWTFDGFKVTTGQETSSHFNAYVAENRQYTSYDSSLKTAYNFGFLNAKPDYVESFSYQEGLLVSYWDTSHEDNNVGDHPGEGMLLPVDAHPTFHHYYDGQLVRPRILSYDSAFSKQDTKSITIHKNSQPTKIPGQKAVPTFDDTKDWWFADDGHAHSGRYEPGWVGVKVPKTGTTVTVKSGGPKSAFLEVVVAPK